MHLRLAPPTGLIGGLLLALTGAAQAETPTVGRHVGWDAGRFEVGPRLTHLALRDRDSDDRLSMGGLGFYMRYRITHRWGAEAAVDAVLADQLGEQSPGEVTRVSTPATLAALFYLWPDDETQFYLLGGIGSADHEIDYAALGETYTYTTKLSTFGFGLQHRTDSIRYDASLRVLNFRNPSDAPTVTPYDSGEQRTVAYRPAIGRHLSGLMFNFGVNWGW